MPFTLSVSLTNGFATTIPLTPPNDAQAVVDRWWHGHRVEEFTHAGAWAPTFGGQSPWLLPATQPMRREPPRIGAWYCPTDASRFGYCHLIATRSQLDQIRAISTAQTGTYANAAPLFPTLTFSDGLGNSVSDLMLVLPPRPISQRGDGRELYLITLVDTRWLAQFPSLVGTNGIDFDTVTWGELLTWYVGWLNGVTIDETDAISANYGTPDPARWLPMWGSNGLGSANSNPYVTPAVVDAICRTVGLRYVYQLNQDAAATSYATAAAADLARWTAYSDQVLAGGRLSGQDCSWGVYGSVQVVFLQACQNWVPGSGVLVPLSSLSIADYGGNTGQLGGISEGGAVIVGDLTLNNSTAPQRQAYAVQAATDYYSWALSRTDATFRGLIPLPPTGLDDAVEWVQLPGNGGIVTRVMRRPFSDHNLYGSAAPWQWPKLVQDVCLSVTKSSGVVTNVDVTVQYLQVDGTTVCETNAGVCCSTSWDCVNGVCTERSDQEGQYASLSACQGAGCGFTYNCVQGSCVQVAGGGGTYATLAACQADCSSPPPPPPPPPPCTGYIGAIGSCPDQCWEASTEVTTSGDGFNECNCLAVTFDVVWSQSSAVYTGTFVSGCNGKTYLFTFNPATQNCTVVDEATGVQVGGGPAGCFNNGQFEGTITTAPNTVCGTEGTEFIITFTLAAG